MDSFSSRIPGKRIKGFSNSFGYNPPTSLTGDRDSLFWFGLYIPAERTRGLSWHLSGVRCRLAAWGRDRAVVI
jgi:hypothetical protein